MMNIPSNDPLSNTLVEPENRIRAWMSRFSFPLIVLIGLLSIIVILWLPFGLNSPDNWDGWMFFARLDQGDTALFNPNFPTRPFTALPWVIAYLISSNSFIGYNLVLAGLLLIKGILTCAIVNWLLKGQQSLAFLCGVVSIIYPADTGVFFLATINVHLSVALFLLSFYLLLVYWKIHRLIAFVGSLLALVGAMGIYEAAFPLIFVVPLVLYWSERRLTKRLVGVAFVWYLIAGTGFLINVLVLQSNSSSYQSTFITQGNLLSNLLVGAIYVYSQHFFRGFQDSIEIVIKVLQGQVPPLFLVLATGAGLITGLIALKLQKNTVTSAFTYRSIVGLAAMNLVFIFLGYLIFIPTDYLKTNIRTFFFASWGASIALVTGFLMLLTLSRLSKIKILLPILLITIILTMGTDDYNPSLIVFAFIVSLLTFLPKSWSFLVILSFIVGLGTLYYLEQHAVYDKSGRDQLTELTQIVQQVPNAEAGTLFLILNEANKVTPLVTTPMTDNNEHFVFNYIFDSALKVIYDNSSLQGRLCNEYTLEVSTEDCTFTDQGISVNPPDVVWFPMTDREFYPYSQVLIFVLTSDGKLILQPQVPLNYQEYENTQNYQPELLINRDSSPPPRAASILNR